MERYSDSERIWSYPGHLKLLNPILLAKCSIPRLGGESAHPREPLLLPAAHFPGVGAVHPAEHCPGSRAPKSPCAPSELNWALTSQLVSENSLEFSILESKLELLILLQAVVVPQSWICASFKKNKYIFTDSFQFWKVTFPLSVCSSADFCTSQ